jgi:hypothetical protein
MIPESEMCGDLRMRTFTSLAILVAVALVHGPNGAAGAEAYAPFECDKTSWHGFVRYDFVMDEQPLAITWAVSARGVVANSKQARPVSRDRVGLDTNSIGDCRLWLLGQMSSLDLTGQARLLQRCFACVGPLDEAKRRWAQ